MPGPDHHPPLAHIEGERKQSLIAHLEGVAGLAAHFAAVAGLARAGELLGLLHDAGKARTRFQTYLLSAAGLLDQDCDEAVDPVKLKGRIDHSTAGAQWLWTSRAPRTRPEDVCRCLLALCLCSHHSGLINCLAPDGENTFAGRMAKKDGETGLAEAMSGLGPDFFARLDSLRDEAMREVSGALKRLADLREGREGAFPECAACHGRRIPECLFPDPLWHVDCAFLTRFLFSCLVDADRTDSADFADPAAAEIRSAGIPDWSALAERLESHLAELAGRSKRAGAADRSALSGRVNALRADISARCLARSDDAPGLFTLTVPTGGGKTLAALRFALRHAKVHGMRRIIHVIPYTSIIDQNAQVARAILEQDLPPDRAGTVVLEQHSNLEPERETWRSKILGENWDAPVVYTTMVQFLESLFGGGTRGARRMHRLAGAVIVFDEIQTLPVKCAHLFCNAVNFLTRFGGSTVVLCTATQPLLGRLPAPHLGQLDLGPEREIMPDVPALYADLRRVAIVDRWRPEGWSPQEAARLALDEAKRAGSCLLVANTKAWAREVYEAAKALGAPDPVYLSTDLCPAHRMQRLAGLRKRLEACRADPAHPAPLLCVSTQLIEAGVDVDFASAVRCLAGFDSILQTAGRCNRNGRDALGMVSLINPRGENLSSLPEIRLGRDATLRVLGECRRTGRDDLTDPAVVEMYFSYYFFQRKDAMAYPVSGARDDTLLSLLACNCHNPGNMEAPAAPRQSFAEAGRLFRVIDEGGRGVIVPWGKGRALINELCGATHPGEIRRLLRLAQRYTVNVYESRLKKLYEAGAAHEIQRGSGIFYLADGRYDKETGLSGRGDDLLTLHC